MKRSLLFCLLFCPGAFEVRAQVYVGASEIVPQGDAFVWSYEARLASGFLLRSNDYFLVYDFGPATNATPQPGWEFSTDLETPSGILPWADHPWIANAGFRYLGPTLAGPATLGTFTLVSTNRDGGFSSQFASRAGTGDPATTPFAEGVNVGNVRAPYFFKQSISGGISTGYGLLSGATITLRQLNPTNGQMIATNEARTTTDANGLYNFPNLPTGFRYSLEASKAGYSIYPERISVPLLFHDESIFFSAIRTNSPQLNIRLSWPAADNGFGLESKPALAGSNTWTTVTNEPTIIDDEHVVELPVEAGERYFRLQERP